MLKVSLVASVLVAAVAVGCSSADPGSPTESTESALGLGNNTELNNPLPRHMPTQERAVKEFAGGGGSGGNLTNHGGPTLTNAHVVPIFWGAAWSGSAIATSLESYVSKFGTTGEYNVITQYSGIQQSNLGTTSWTDTTNPSSTNVTDAMIQAEVSKYLQTHAFDASAIYEVFLPNGYYSSDGTSTSCGGTNLSYCAYHGNFNASQGNVKYASMPYPSCGGCQTAGFSDTQNFEHFISHETREAVTDADGNAWYDRRGYEADDKCAWTPTPFTDSSVGTNSDGTAFAYQYEWSNAVSGCVRTR